MVRPHLVNGTAEAQAAAQGYPGPGEATQRLPALSCPGQR